MDQPLEVPTEALLLLERSRLDALAEDCFVILDRLTAATDHVEPLGMMHRKLTTVLHLVADLLDRIQAEQLLREAATTAFDSQAERSAA